MSRHVLIARMGEPHIWGRADYAGGRWTIAANVSSSLAALIGSAIPGLGENDLTVTPRLLPELIARGDPERFNIPASATIQLFLLRRLGNDMWQSALIQPSRAVRTLLKGSEFVASMLSVKLSELFTEADLRDRCRMADRREVWVRQNWAADQLFHEQVPAPSPPPPDYGPGPPPAIDMRTDLQIEANERRDELKTPLQRDAAAEKAAAKRKIARQKVVVKKKIAADAFNRTEAKKYADRVSAEVTAAQKVKKR